ncbi:hypothetical protein [Mycobacterium uberis]|uniref:hypothetical protein n=1 Tax=Mycobacterium uberis TaxID=2162698 RepID=UPI003C7949D4
MPSSAIDNAASQPLAYPAHQGYADMRAEAAHRQIHATDNDFNDHRHAVNLGCD